MITTCLLIAASTGAVAQDQILYQGDALDGKSITVGSWGSGQCEDIAKSGYTGSHSLKITARSLFEGGRIDFVQPVDLTQHFKNPNAYLQLITKMSLDATGVDDPLLDGFAPDAGSSSPSKTPVSRVRVVMKIDGGPMVECQADLAGFKVADDGWMTLSFPFSAFKGKKDRPAYKISRIVISADGNEPFYVGQIQIVTDTTEITADPGLDQFVAANDDVMFRPSSEGGAASMRYAWDFDDKDGLQEDAIGEVVYHKYRKPGKYTVTLTVSDAFGIKESVTKTLKIEVFD